MSTQKHTPGEWSYKSNGTYFEINPGIADVKTYGDFEEQEANAKLITASPLLLEALYKLYVYTLNPSNKIPLDIILNECEAAIEKAGGFER
jgi:hypothetical protein